MYDELTISAQVFSQQGAPHVTTQGVLKMMKAKQMYVMYGNTVSALFPSRFVCLYIFFLELKCDYMKKHIFINSLIIINK